MQEIERQKRVLNMMVSMHADLRDSYKFKSLVVEIFLLLSAVILNALVFVNYEYIKMALSITTEFAQLYIGVFSIVVFAISVIMLLVNWKEKAASHAQAASELFKLLQETRELIDEQPKANNPLLLKNLQDKYKHVNNVIASIPENKFNRLKAKHLRKVELSKYISKNPQLPYWLLKIKFFFYSLKQSEKKKHEE